MIQIVEATPADYAVIRRLAYEIWPGTYGHILSKTQLDYMLDAFYSIENLTECAAKNHHFLLVKDSQRDIGFMSYEHGYKGKPATRIHKIYVLPETQGKGIGKLLIERAETLAKAAKSDVLSLNVNRFNNAVSFYKKLGFGIVGEEDIEIGHGYLMEDFMMEKLL